jgi:hypothetical protein
MLSPEVLSYTILREKIFQRVVYWLRAVMRFEKLANITRLRKNRLL